ncbi:hypothetical protein RKD23_004648 [Streptomyces sp. SAI-170]|uniref:hypothetical protein n=1 Tax=Streptomyces sp. SAI-170 TaxID=3377729 RepID=UPI003C7986F2
MKKRQVRKMLGQMATGQPVTVRSPMASVKKLARFAYVAQQFGYEYADVRQGGQHNSEYTMLLVPDHSPQGRARAAQNWAQYPNAGDGVSLPPLVPNAVDLLKARIKFDISGRHAEKQRIRLAAIGIPLACVGLVFELGTDTTAFVVAGVLCAAGLGLLPLGLAYSRRDNARQAALLQAAGFTQVRDETGRLRYVPPGGQLPGHGNPFAGGTAPGVPPQTPYAPGVSQPYAAGPHAVGPHAVGPHAVGPQAPGPHAPGPYTPGPYGPVPPQPQHSQPAHHPQPYPQQNPHWQPPRT